MKRPIEVGDVFERVTNPDDKIRVTVAPKPYVYGDRVEAVPLVRVRGCQRVRRILAVELQRASRWRLVTPASQEGAR